MEIPNNSLNFPNTANGSHNKVTADFFEYTQRLNTLIIPLSNLGYL